MTSTISSGSPRTLPLAGCPVCGSSDDRPFLEMPDRRHGIPGTYSFRRCEECHITPARKFRMLLHTNPTRERGECLETRAGASEDM